MEKHGIFIHVNEVIEIGPECLEWKGKVLGIVQPTMRSLLGYDTRPPMTRNVY